MSAASSDFSLPSEDFADDDGLEAPGFFGTKSITSGFKSVFSATFSSDSDLSKMGKIIRKFE